MRTERGRLGVHGKAVHELEGHWVKVHEQCAREGGHRPPQDKANGPREENFQVKDLV